MKKWLLILAVGFTAVSCTWWHETFNSAEDCQEWYLEELSDAEDLDEFEEIYNDYTLWNSKLGQVDSWKAYAKEQEWADDNEKKYERINEKINKLRELYRD